VGIGAGDICLWPPVLLNCISALLGQLLLQPRFATKVLSAKMFVVCGSRGLLATFDLDGDDAKENVENGKTIPRPVTSFNPEPRSEFSALARSSSEIPRSIMFKSSRSVRGRASGIELFWQSLTYQEQLAPKRALYILAWCRSPGENRANYEYLNLLYIRYKTYSWKLIQTIARQWCACKQRTQSKTRGKATAQIKPVRCAQRALHGAPRASSHAVPAALGTCRRP
jgi:hypothetical protein